MVIHVKKSNILIQFIQSSKMYARNVRRMKNTGEFYLTIKMDAQKYIFR